jgi:hypothetical protein
MGFATTAKSGYIQRRIIKLTEDIKVQYNGTVTDTTGKIYQMNYGEDGLDPINTIRIDGEQEVCDISRMVAKLNMEHEVKTEDENKKVVKAEPKKKVSKFKKDKEVDKLSDMMKDLKV